MDQNVALDTSLGQDVVFVLLVAVASVLTAALLAAGDAQPLAAAALAVAAGPEAALAACLLQEGLQARAAVAPGQPQLALPLVRRQDVAELPQQVDWLAVQVVSALAEPTFPAWEML